MSIATASVSNPIVGAKLVKQLTGRLESHRRRHPHDLPSLPSGTQIWQISRDLQDLREHAFVAGHNRAEIVAALEAQYPAAHSLLTRVEGVKLQSEWKDNKLVQPAPLQYLVHERPLLDLAIASQKLGEGIGPERVLHALGGDTRVTALARLTHELGPILMHRDVAEDLRSDDGFEESSLVVAPFTRTNYALVKFSPSKAKARRTRQDNKTASIAHAEELGRAAAEMRTRIDALSQALINDLTTAAPFLRFALPDREDCHDADDWEPRRYEHGGYRGAWSGRLYSTANSPQTGSRKCLARLYAITKIHEQFRGRRAYRRCPQWTALRDQYDKLPEGLDPERWGCWKGPLSAFLEGEMRSRRPRPRPRDPVGQRDGDGGLHELSPAQATRE